jgi:general secretion pathway protein D
MRMEMNNKLVRRFGVLIMLAGLCWSSLLHAAEEWSINLRDADIRAFIDQVSTMTGRTFVVDQRVKGKVTVIAPKAMNGEAVYQVFLSVLNVNGYAAVPSGKVIKIVPDATAKQDSLPLDTSGLPRGADMITRVIPVNGSPAVELVPVLRPLVPQSGHMAAVASANVLIVTDQADNIARLEQVIARIDGAEAEELEVIQLNHAWVGDVIDILNTFAASAEAAKSPRGGGTAVSGGRVRVVADERTNRLILRGEASARARMVRLVQTLDVPAEANTGSVQVLRLKHADAKKTAEILKGMVDSGSGGGSSSSSAGGKEGGAAALMNPVGARVAIQPDESLNALVVRAEPSVMQQIRAVVAQLDVRRAQILIEAAIVEVGGTNGKDLGVQWAAGDTDSGLMGINFSGNGRSVNEIAAAVAAPETSRGLADGITLAGGKTDRNGDPKFGGVLQALVASANVNLLSTPSVLTLDNQEANIVVGENVPFVTGQSTSTGDGTSNPFTTIKREDIGIKLKVTPTVIDDENVRLVIEQEVSSVKPSEDGVNSSDIITSKRSISTTVLAENRETIVLGGLIEDRVTETVKKVPLLGDIPAIGILFRSTSVSRGKQNLMVFLRPSILTDGEAARKLSAEKYQGVRALAFAIDSRGDISRVQEGEEMPDQAADLFRGYSNGRTEAGKAEGGSDDAPGKTDAAGAAPAERAPAGQPSPDATATVVPAPAASTGAGESASPPDAPGAPTEAGAEGSSLQGQQVD